MKASRITYLLVLIPISCFLFSGLTANQGTSQDECALTSRSQIYSNAAFNEEAGDVVGEELAIHRHNDNSIGARLYIYEGEPNLDGISVSGKLSEGNLMMKGQWIVHLTEEPSRKEITEVHPVEISGKLDSNWFRGTIKAGDVETVKMKRADHIWMCKR